MDVMFVRITCLVLEIHRQDGHPDAGIKRCIIRREGVGQMGECGFSLSRSIYGYVWPFLACHVSLCRSETASRLCTLRKRRLASLVGGSNLGVVER